MYFEHLKLSTEYILKALGLPKDTCKNILDEVLSDMVKKAIVKLPEDDYLSVQNLKRIDLDSLEPKVDITERAKRLKLQLYILGTESKSTIFGCLVDDDSKILWFGYHTNKEGNIVPDSEYSLDHLMSVCDSKIISPLLYHLDILG
jgi:hypothetical protein